MISIIIPAYNEQLRIVYALDSLISCINDLGRNVEIIVVDDGSEDDTVEVVNGYVDSLNIRVVKIEKNQGKGFAVRKGVTEAQGEIILFTDADGSTDISDMREMIRRIEIGYDLVIGSRDEIGSKIINRQSFGRVFLGKGFNLLVRLFLGLYRFKDTQCGFKGFKREAAKEVFNKTEIDRFAFDVEVLSIALVNGLKVSIMPVTWDNKKESKVHLGGVLSMGVDLVKIKYNTLFGKYYFKKKMSK